MKPEESTFTGVAQRLEALAKSNAVVGPHTEVGGRTAIPLVEISLGLGGGGGAGEGSDPQTGARGKGHGGAAAGSARVTPVAVLVVEGGKVTLQSLGH